jgi:GntR family transcriptional regulator
VSSLVHEGVLEKIHGRGTFLANNHHTVNEWLGRLTSFTETVESMGMKPGIRLLSHGIAHDPKIIQILGQEECYRIERLRFADDAPVALERTNYPLEIGLKLARYDLDRVTLYTALEGNGIVLHTAEQRITAKVPSEQDARLLGIARNVSVLAAERVTYDPEGAIIEYYESIFRADKYAFCVRMHRQSTSIGLKEKSVRTI